LRVETFDVEEVFLIPDPKYEYEKIRKRGQNHAYSYSYAVRTNAKNLELRTEIKRIISAREYLTLFEKKDTNKRIIHKKRSAFIYDK